MIKWRKDILIEALLFCIYHIGGPSPPLCSNDDFSRKEMHSIQVKILRAHSIMKLRHSNGFNPILPGLLNTRQTRGGAYFTRFS